MTGQVESTQGPHLRLTRKQVAPVVLVVGDPFRTVTLAKCADGGYTELQQNREYRSINVVHKGTKITICSHGVGGPGAAVCFEELIQYGAKVIIRLGTCGSLQPRRIAQGDIAISTAAIREDGVTQFLVAPAFPAVADMDVTMALRQVAEELDYTDGNVFTGLTYTNACFFPGPLKSEGLKLSADSGALTVEMETSCLFTIASIRGIRAGAVAAVDGSPFEWDSGNYDPTGEKVTKAKQHMFQIGLNAAVKLTNEQVWLRK